MMVRPGASSTVQWLRFGPNVRKSVNDFCYFPTLNQLSFELFDTVVALLVEEADTEQLASKR